MTSTEMLSRLRALLDEPSAGFYTDAQLYQYLDSAQNLIIEFLISKQRSLRTVKGDTFEIETLKPLIKLTSAIATGANPNISLSGVNDIIELYQIYLYNNSSGTELLLTYIPLRDLKQRSQNSYTAHSYNSTLHTGQVYCSLYQGNILTSFNAITTDTSSFYDKAKVYYYAQPTAVSAGQNYTLPSETHEAGILFAVSLALEQDKKTQEAKTFFNQAQQLIQNL